MKKILFLFTLIAVFLFVPVSAYTIDYELEGGETAISNPETYSSTTETFTLVNPTREGYDFDGWTGSNGKIPEMVVKIEKGSTGNKTFIAN